ncbi:hypothetical protein Q7417_00045 [Glaesserella parasuis]|uniref:Wzy n=2 Tax=Glaesserella parasuis TaxID=738 RepID=A0A859IEP7_GLAPU|nr:hypothetical protein [Glaesserella parasuis]MDP0074662.1 hypothetical protein [Glaesserella parasuis]MDP0089302.1 hypothetical protein [Glaesserella parasuis]MDP0208176.1 hypothetical protein [Glaesserella parasuis]MDP0336418.1 hypothetical protein [Glaesserella parasuis]
MNIVMPFLFMVGVSIMNFGLLTIMFSVLILLGGKRLLLRYSFSEFIIYIIFIGYLICGWETFEDSSDKLYLISFLYFFMAVIFAKIFLGFERVYYIRAIEYFIYFYIGIIILQYILFFTFKIYLDFHNIITLGEYQSRIDSNTISSLGLIRATGLSIEPSNASSTIAYLVCLYFFLENDMSKKYLILSPTITLSFTSILVFIPIYFFSIILGNLRKNIICYLVLGSIILYIGYMILRYRLSYDDYDAISFRSLIIYFLLESSWLDLLVGHGIYMSEIPIQLGGYTLYHSHIRDAGLFFNLIFSFGIPITVIFYYFFLKKLFSTSALSAILFIALGMLKFDYMQPIFWFVISIIATYKPDNLRRH